MKEGWEYKKIEDCCDILDSYRKPITKSKRVKGLIPYYGATGLLDYVKDYIFDESLVLLGEDGAKWGAGEASAYEISGKTWVNNHAHVLRPHKDKIVNTWLIYYLNYENLSPYIKGITVPKLNQRSMCSIVIPVPPLSEQQRIVSYLDAAFAKIDAVAKNAEEALNEAKALFQSALTKMMEPKEGWKYKKLGEVFTTYSGGTPLKYHKEYYESGNIPWLRSGEVCRKYINQTELFITEKGLNNSSAKYFPVNTVVVAMYGATAAQVGILKIKSTSNQAVCGILPNDNFSPEFIYYWFTFNKDNLAAQAQGGAQPNISQIKIKNIHFPILPLSDQRHIVSYLDVFKSKVDQLQSNLTLTLTDCAALKQAILRQTFE